MKSTFVFLVGLFASSIVVAQGGAPKPGDIVEYNYAKPNNPELFGMEYKSPREAYVAISGKIDIQKLEIGDIEGFADIGTGVLWVFTTTRNPAHPAVMKLKAFESNGNLFMKNSVLCGASKSECDRFVSYQQYLVNSVTALHQAHKEFSNTGPTGGAVAPRQP